MSARESLEKLLDHMPEERLREIVDFAAFLNWQDEQTEWRQFGQAQLARAMRGRAGVYPLGPERGEEIVSPGDVVLIPLAQFAGGAAKLRPALLLAALPGAYQNLLLCGISTQLQQLQPNWDELIHSGDADFPSSGLHRDSAIRLSYMYAAEPSEIAGVIGTIDPSRLHRLRQRLSDHLRP